MAFNLPNASDLVIFIRSNIYIQFLVGRKLMWVPSYIKEKPNERMNNSEHYVDTDLLAWPIRTRVFPVPQTQQQRQAISWPKSTSSCIHPGGFISRAIGITASPNSVHEGHKGPSLMTRFREGGSRLSGPGCGHGFDLPFLWWWLSYLPSSASSRNTDLLVFHHLLKMLVAG